MTVDIVDQLEDIEAHAAIPLQGRSRGLVRRRPALDTCVAAARFIGAFVARSIVRIIVGSWLRGRHTRYIFENWDDPSEFQLGADDPDVTIVGGAGVDPNAFPMYPEPAAPPVRIAVVARMIRPKGITEAIDAVRRARVAGAAVELHLFGEPDPVESSYADRSRVAAIRGRARHHLAWPHS
jgi:hypothetical protein